MSDNQVVTELVIDASAAIAGADQYNTAADSIASSSQTATDQTAKLQQAIDQQIVSFTKAPPSIASVQAQFDKLNASLDPTVKNQQKMQQATDTVTAAQQRGVITQTQANAVLDLAAAKYSTASGLSAAFADATSSVTRSMVAMSAGAGPVGVFLSALGPWGLAASVGIGVAASAFETMSAGAADLAQKATALQAFQAATEINTDQIQALDIAAAQFGITGDTVARQMENFASSVGQAQQGSGTLFASLLKTNPALALQVSGAHDVAQAFNLVAQAYAAAADAGNAAGAAAIARAAFGRQGAASGPALLGTTAQSGGIAQLAAQVQVPINPELSQQLTALNAQLAITKEAATDAWESLFSADVLTAEIQFYNGIDKIVGVLKIFSDSMGSTGQLAHGLPTALLSLLGPAGMLPAALLSLTGPAAPAATTTPTTSDVDLGISAAGLAGLGGGELSLTASSAALYAAQQKVISALAGTATPAQQLQVQFLELKKAVDDHTLSADQATKAQSLLVEAFNVNQIQANVSAMGALASPTQQYISSIAKLQLELDQGKISQYAFTAGSIAAGQAMESSTVSIKEQYGLASDAEIASVALEKYNDDMAKIGATAQQSAAGVVVVQKQIQAVTDSMKVAASTTPQFTQLLLNISNQNKVNDELLTSGANALLQAGPAFTQALQQGATIAAAISASFTKAANSIADAFATAGAKSLVADIGALATSVQNAVTSAISSAASSSGSGTGAPLNLAAVNAGSSTATSSLSNNGGAFGTVGNFAIAFAISEVTSALSQWSQQQAAWAQAQQTWASAQGQFTQFMATLAGVCAGSLTAALDEKSTGINVSVAKPDKARNTDRKNKEIRDDRDLLRRAA